MCNSAAHKQQGYGCEYDETCITVSCLKTLFSGTVGIKRPPTVLSILAPQQKCVTWAVFCLPVHTGVFVNANWPAYQPAKWNTASLTHRGLFVIEWIQMVLRPWHCASHCQPWDLNKGVWPVILYLRTTHWSGGSHQFTDCRLEREKSLILSRTNSKISIPWHPIHLNLLYVVSMENLLAH